VKIFPRYDVCNCTRGYLYIVRQRKCLCIELNVIAKLHRKVLCVLDHSIACFSVSEHGTSTEIVSSLRVQFPVIVFFSTGMFPTMVLRKRCAVPGTSTLYNRCTTLYMYIQVPVPVFNPNG
jgi:hypothetical protein